MLGTLLGKENSYIATLLENIGEEYNFGETTSNQQQTLGKIDVPDIDLETLVQENPDYLVIYSAQADLNKCMDNTASKPSTRLKTTMSWL